MRASGTVWSITGTTRPASASSFSRARSFTFAATGRSPVKAMTARRLPTTAVHGAWTMMASDGTVVRYRPPGLRRRRHRPDPDAAGRAIDENGLSAVEHRVVTKESQRGAVDERDRLGTVETGGQR